MKSFLVLFLGPVLTISTIASADIYKCKDKRGQVTFSQMPCAPDAKKIIVKTTEPTAEDQEQARLTIEKNNAMVKAQQDSRQINAAKNRVEKLIKERDAKLQQLKIKKLYATNSLAGATWEKSISEEMSAVTERYNADIESARVHVHELESRKK
jgi:hypothetical protein